MFDRRSLGIYLAPAYVERVSAFICSLYIQINFAPALMLELGLQTIFSMLKVAIKSIVISSLISSLVSKKIVSDVDFTMCHLLL